MLSRGHRFAQGKPFRIPERAIQSSCRQLARLHEGAGRLVCIRISNTGVMHDGGKRMTKNPEMLGITDFVLLIKGGPTLWVELKADDGRMSPGQQVFRDRVTRVGHIYRIVRSIEEFENLLAEYGVPRLTLLPS
jgi:hypothetical protein